MGTVVFYFFVLSGRNFFGPEKTGPEINSSLISILCKKTTRVAEGVGYMEASIFFAAEKTAAVKNLASNVKKLKSAHSQRVWIVYYLT